MSSHDPDQVQVEQRLVALEGQVADLQQRLADRPQATGWLDRVIGSIGDEAAFLEALELGRAIRSADRPGDEVAATS